MIINKTAITLFAVFSAFYLTVAVKPVLADEMPDAVTLLNEMTEALRNLNYDGVFIYKRGRSVNTMRIIHKVDNNGVQERLISLSGHPREVLRNNKSVTCIFPDNKSVMVEKSRAGEALTRHIPESYETLAQYYAIGISGQGRIADHDAWVINIKPQDQYRYGYQLWIDKENKLLLKSTLRNMTGYPLEEIVFTRLDVVDDIPSENLQAGMTTTNFTWKHSTDRFNNKNEQKNPWQVSWMPAGFEVNQYERQPVSNSTYTDQIVVSDGLAVVSVFIEKVTSADEIIQGPARVGGINAFARYANGYTVTAIGEVPLSTVQRMSNSVVSLY